MQAIVAFDQKLGMGLNGYLPWPNIPEDFKWFKETTMGKNILFGRKTFQNLPILKKRTTYVVSKNYLNDFAGIDYGDGTVVVYQRNFDSLPKDIIICGGAKIYKQLLPDCEELYVTHVNGVYECDTYFPFSQEVIDRMFPHNSFIREFSGGHKVIKYSKK